jgi:exopolyphosphatase / guanosine-5'-triphosphate,3'-diphosphate pyrophosphatase
MPPTVETSPSTPPAPQPAANRPIAVIDIGTSAIRMAIAEVNGGQISTLESLSQGVRLGKDTFTRNEISRSTIEDTVRVLKSYRQKLEEYGITRSDQIRVVATSAVREAVNRLALLDRIYVATGLTVEPVEEAEVHRITFRSIQPLLLKEKALVESQTIICEVGGGNTELLLIDKGNVAYSHSYRLGSLRLRQAMEIFRAPQDKVQEIMQSEIERALDDVPELIPPGDRKLIGLGGDLRFAAGQLLPAWEAGTLASISVDDLARLTAKVAPLSEDAIVRRYHLTFPDAETLAPALMTYVHLARTLGVSHLFVSSANLRDGLLREMAEGWTWTEDFRRQIFRSAVELGRKYDFDEEHGTHVATLSRQLFQALREEHKLDSRYELILMLSAMLHEIGRYVSNTSMHKHSMYLITNSDLFGLGSQDMLLVGLVARYHRRAMPKSTHPGFNTLDRERRVAVLKLAAMLRIAIALDASRAQRVHEIKSARHKQRLIITVPDVEDLSVEQLALKQGSGMFEDVFGLKVQLRTAERPQLRGSSSQL